MIFTANAINARFDGNVWYIDVRLFYVMSLTFCALLQHEDWSLKMFDYIYENNKKAFDRRHLTSSDIDFIKELIEGTVDKVDIQKFKWNAPGNADDSTLSQLTEVVMDIMFNLRPDNIFSWSLIVLFIDSVYEK